MTLTTGHTRAAAGQPALATLWMINVLSSDPGGDFAVVSTQETRKSGICTLLLLSSLLLEMHCVT